MSSEVRQRNIKGRPDTKEEPLAGSKVSGSKKSSGGSSILPLLLLLGIVALGGVFFYINQTHGETYAQTGERIKQRVTETIQSFSKAAEGLANQGTQAAKKATGGSKTAPSLTGLQSNHSKNFRLTYEDNALTLTSVRCEQPSTVDKDIKEIITWIGEEYGNDVESFSLPSYVCTQFSNRGLVAAVSSLAQSFKNLKTLNLNFRGAKGITDEGVIKAYQILAEKLPNVDDLTLNFTLHVPQAYQLTDKSVNGLIDLLNNGKFKNLRRLHLMYAGAQNLTSEAVSRLFTAIGKNLPNLKDLGLDLRWIGTYGDSLLQSLSKEMLAGTYKNLLRFSLNLDNNGENFSNGGFQEFARGVAGLTSVTHFHISFYGAQRVTGAGFSEIYKSLADKKLEVLSLNYPGNTGFTDDALIGLNALAKVIPNLKGLNLMLMKAALTSKSLVEFAKLFDTPLPKLELFNLDLTTGDKIGNEGVDTLIKNLGKNAPNLKDFLLKLDSQKTITHEILALFASTFETSLHKLNRFHFGFRDLKGNYDDVVVQLFQSIGKNLKNIEDLGFTFGNMQISDVGIKGISQALSTNYRNLKSLKIVLSSLEGVNDESLKVFSDALLTLKNLETLDIHLSAIQKTKTAGVNYFLKKITEISSLKVLDLTFMGVEGVSDDSVRVFRTNIKDLTNLTELGFDLTMNQGVSDASLTNLATSISESGLSLKRFMLKGINRPKRPAQLKLAIYNLLPSIPDLEIMT